MKRYLVFMLLIGAIARPTFSENLDYETKSTKRVSFEVGVGEFGLDAGFSEGPILRIGTPLWLGRLHQHHQLVLEAGATGAFSAEKSSGLFALDLQAGLDLYLNSTFGLEMRMGFAGFVIWDKALYSGLAQISGGGYIIRFGEGKQKKLKLHITFMGGVTFQEQVPSDFIFNAGLLGFMLGYETPF